jgi:hypothetical protein
MKNFNFLVSRKTFCLFFPHLTTVKIVEREAEQVDVNLRGNLYAQGAFDV